MFLAAHRDRLVTIRDIADAHHIAKNHLTKVVHQLGIMGVVESVRGRNGGLRLGREPGQISIGAVARSTEPDFYMAGCFNPGKSHCTMSAACSLKDVLNDATHAYLAVLDGITLDHLMDTRGKRTSPEAFFRSIPIRLEPEAPQTAEFAADRQPPV